MRGFGRGSNLVVRTHAPLRRAITVAALVLLGLFALYFAYELGRYDAGYDRLAAAQQRTELEVTIERLSKANRELRTKLAELDTIRIGRAQERVELSRTIGDLQAEVARQAQELAFYRGIVTEGASPSGVKLQQLRISATEDPLRYRIRLTLIRSGRPDGAVSGSVLLTAEGELDGRSATLDLAALTGGKQRELPFSFRYYENFDQEITLSPGFRPERLTVEVRSNRKGIAPLTETFLWNVDGPRGALALEPTLGGDAPGQ